MLQPQTRNLSLLNSIDDISFQPLCALHHTILRLNRQILWRFALDAHVIADDTGYLNDTYDAEEEVYSCKSRYYISTSG